MEPIVDFLAQHLPFSLLSGEQIRRAAAAVQIEYFPAGADILVQDGAPSAFLYIVRRGSVDLLRAREQMFDVVDTLVEGDTFGYVSIIRDRAPIVTVRAREETLAYLLPKAVFQRLQRDSEPFFQFFARSIGERLDRALHSQHAGADPDLFQARLAHLLRRPLITIEPGASVGGAARLMDEQQVSCLVVTSAPPGIVTDRDLRGRVLARGLSDTTAVADVMSAPALTLPADSLVFEGLLLMLERGIHHLPVTEGERIVGVVTNTDILRRKSHSPLFLPRQLQRAQTLGELRAYADQVAEAVGALLESRARVSDIGRMVAIANDALLARLLGDAEAALGPPPCPYAWLVLGSEGRYEQTLRTDQDNALIYADNPAAGAEDYFARLADRVVEQLVACGFPRCPGEIMATNPHWRQPARAWRSYFHHWVTVPDEEALLRVAIFFDYRSVYGALDADAALRPVIAQARGQRVFLGRLARAALRQPAPLGLLRRIVLERRGDQHDLLDLKLRGTAMIVDLARLFALEAGCAATNTLARLRDSAGRASLSAETAQSLMAAFELIGLLRLRHQHRQIQRGERPTNLVAVARLDPQERRDLKEALRAVERAQRDVEMVFQTALIA
jgi:CBS domain-containing protein